MSLNLLCGSVITDIISECVCMYLNVYYVWCVSWGGGEGGGSKSSGGRENKRQ